MNRWNALIALSGSGKSLLLGTALALAAHAWPAEARAGILEDPSGQITSISGGPDFTYAMTLSNASAATEPIGTFWFAWVPGEDFLPTAPLSETAPTGWTVNAITHGGSSDGYAIRWEATSAASDIPIGGSLSGFSFTTADSPAAVEGNSPFYPTTPVLTSFAYDAGPFSDAGTQFQVQSSAVPEPAALTIMALPTLWLLRRSRRQA